VIITNLGRVNPFSVLFFPLSYKTLICVLICINGIKLNIHSQSFKELEDLLRDEIISGASISIKVSRCRDGETIFSYNEKAQLIPASVQKLLVNYAAMELLGPAKTFKTFFYLEGKLNDQGYFDGNFIVDPNLNPVFGSNVFRESKPSSIFQILSKKFAEAGISKFSGFVIPFLRRGDPYRLPEDWYIEDLAHEYGAWPGVFNYKDNLSEISVFWEDNNFVAYYENSIYFPSWLNFNVEIVKRPTNAKVSKSLSFRGGQLVWDVTARLQESENIKLFILNPQPYISFYNDFIYNLDLISLIDGDRMLDLSFEYDPKWLSSVPLFVWESPTLFRIDSVINHRSDNFLAEMLFLNLFPEEHNYKGKLKALSDFWLGRIGDKIDFNDASGLSRSNLISSDCMVRCLNYIFSSPYFYEFYHTLPLWGISGTLKNLARPKDITYGRIRAKSGSMTGVQCYAGYLNTTQNDFFCFSIMVNNFNVDNKNTDIQNWVNKTLSTIIKNINQ